MNKKLALLAFVLLCGMQSQSRAGILFGTPVNLNFTAVSNALSSPALNTVNNITGLNFGDIVVGSNNSTARIAVNHTDTNANGFGVGDTIKVVGHGLIDQATRSVGGSLSPLDAGQPTFQMTGVLRDVMGTVTINPSLPFPQNLFPFNNVTSGFLDLYVDTSADDFTVGNVANSVDGLKVATFEILSGITFLTGQSTTNSTYQFKLVSQLGDGTASLADDFFQLQNGLDPLSNTSLLATQILSLDVRTDEVLTGISGGTDPLDVGTNFNPGPLPSGDFYANVDGSSTFGVVPEPSSILAFLGLSICGGFAARRARK